MRDCMYAFYRGETLTVAEAKYVSAVNKQWKHLPPFRNPQTHAEAMAVAGHLVDEDIQTYKVRIRASRRPGNLPNSYDDLPRSRYGSLEHFKPWRSAKQRRLQEALLCSTSLV